MLSLAACGGDVLCGGDVDNGPTPGTDPIVGAWALSTMDGLGLPVQQTIIRNVFVYLAVGGSALTTDGGLFTATYRGTVNGVAASLVIEGAWIRMKCFEGLRHRKEYVLFGRSLRRGLLSRLQRLAATRSLSIQIPL